ncbi:MAG: MFS transporter [Acidiferrobacterales bacterium]
MSANRTARRRPRATLATCGTAHFLHDGFSDALYVFLPLWAQAFGLSLTQVGVLKAVFTGALAGFQLPSGFLAERLGERMVLAVGTVIAGLGFILLGFADGFYALIVCLLVAGLGCGTQHPLSSALVVHAFVNDTRRIALGMYNFTGDLGKVVVPALIAVGAATIGWRGSAIGYGTIGVVAACAIFLVLKGLQAGVAPAPHTTLHTFTKRARWGIRHRRGFALLSVIAVIDFSTRTGFLTFLPFLLIAKGAQVETVGLALALVFGGGAAGKVLCGIGAARFGIIRTAVLTELITGGGILLLVGISLVPALVLLPLVGFGLNGTSTVLYGTVAEFAAPERQSRAFGFFYTVGVGASALAPLVYGIASDLAGVPVTLVIVALVALISIPLFPLLSASLATAREELA